ncbi:MAG TPA: hypothetical protein VGB83_10845 [Actinomycetota bacterium]
MKRFLGVTTALLALLASGALPSQAHSSSTYYAYKWKNQNGSSKTQEWKFTNSVPTSGGWRARVKDGVNQWNSVGTPMQWVKISGGDYADYDIADPQQGCPAAGKNSVRYGYIDGPGNTIAHTVICLFTGTLQLSNIQITIDSSETNWNTGTGDTPDGGLFGCALGGCGLDLWGNMAHEWGHAVGMDLHFQMSDPDTCSPGDRMDFHTMCAFYSGGSDRERTLEGHDSGTFIGAYP